MDQISQFLTEYKSIVIIAHAISAAIGLGSASVSDILFFQFLKDGNITNKETPILDIMTRIMWVATGLLVVTGLLLFLSNPQGYLLSSKFIVKMFIVLIIIINGVFMTKYLHKHMQELTFSVPYHRKVKRLAFASGAISIGSWYLSFLLGSVRSIPLKTASGIMLYLSFLVVSILVSQLVYLWVQKKFLNKNL